MTDETTETQYLTKLDCYRVDLGGMDNCPVGPRGHWALADFFLGDLCAVGVLGWIGCGAPGDDTLLVRDDLRAIARATLSLLTQEGALVPVVCFLKARGERARERVTRWVLDGEWHDGEAAFFLAPQDDGELAQRIHELLVPRVRRVEGVEALTDSKFREIVNTTFADSVTELGAESLAGIHLATLADALRNGGSFDEKWLATRIINWVRGGIGGAP